VHLTVSPAYAHRSHRQRSRHRRQAAVGKRIRQGQHQLCSRAGVDQRPVLSIQRNSVIDARLTQLAPGHRQRVEARAPVDVDACALELIGGSSRCCA
jgi:hypothetical protein